MLLCGFTASNIFPMQPCGFSASTVLLSSAPASNIFPMALCYGALASNISADTAPLPATASRWHSATASRLAGQQLCLGAPASNKPHSAERSTPVWLAIWRTWAGFANSQLRRATIRAPNNISTHPHCCHIGRCSDRANLSTHLHRLPTPPPYLRRMRLSPGRGAGVGCWIWLWFGGVRRSCKSPRARLLGLSTSGAHWPARWPRFELTERVDKS